MIKFSLSKFRCFYEAKPSVIAPITLLVGENSTGKTSYLAALRTTFACLSYESLPSFNNESFHLGAFNQIVNVRRGSKHGRASEFSFSISSEIKTQTEIDRGGGEKFMLPPGEILAKFVFRKSGSQPTLAVSEVSYLNYKSQIEFFDGGHITLSKGRESFKLKQTQFSDMFGGEKMPNHFLYVTLMMWRVLSRNKATENDISVPEFTGDVARILADAVFHAFDDVLSKSLRAIAPIRSKPRRTYDPKEDSRDTEGEYVPYRLARLKHEDRERFREIKAALEKFGNASGLFDGIEIKQLGKTDSDPFQMMFKIKGTSSNLVDVGYGVSQAVPLVTDLVLEDRAAIFLIQQPEVHLHPKAQAEFASFMVQLAKETGSYLIIETHSDYMLDRLRSHVRTDKNFNKEDLSIIYFERKGQTVSPHPIKIDDAGEVIEAPISYRKFFLREEMRLLGLRDVHHN